MKLPQEKKTNLPQRSLARQHRGGDEVCRRKAEFHGRLFQQYLSTGRCCAAFRIRRALRRSTRRYRRLSILLSSCSGVCSTAASDCRSSSPYSRPFSVARVQIVQRITSNREIASVAVNTHGTRAVQKLVETLDQQEQVSLLIAALQPSVVELIKDLNGNHVIQRCLQKLDPANC